MLIDVGTVWSHIQAHEGEVFHQIRRKASTYEVRGAMVWLHNLTVGIHRSQFERALCLVPLESTVPLQNL